MQKGAHEAGCVNGRSDMRARAKDCLYKSVCIMHKPPVKWAGCRAQTVGKIVCKIRPNGGRATVVADDEATQGWREAVSA